MKKLILFFVSISCMTYTFGSTAFEKNFSTDTKQINISTNAAIPTQILTNEAYVERTWIVNTSTMAIFISTASNNCSATTSFQIPGSPANSQAVIWSPDGNNNPYSGPMFAASNPSGSVITISVFRAK